MSTYHNGLNTTEHQV